MHATTATLQRPAPAPALGLRAGEGAAIVGQAVPCDETQTMWQHFFSRTFRCPQVAERSDLPRCARYFISLGDQVSG
jgi:hypothetical protein